jgi:hypothetical protein
VVDKGRRDRANDRGVRRYERWKTSSGFRGPFAGEKRRDLSDWPEQPVTNFEWTNTEALAFQTVVFSNCLAGSAGCLRKFFREDMITAGGYCRQGCGQGMSSLHCRSSLEGDSPLRLFAVRRVAIH